MKNKKKTAALLKVYSILAVFLHVDPRKNDPGNGTDFKVGTFSDVLSRSAVESDFHTGSY